MCVRIRHGFSASRSIRPVPLSQSGWKELRCRFGRGDVPEHGRAPWAGLLPRTGDVSAEPAADRIDAYRVDGSGGSLVTRIAISSPVSIGSRSRHARGMKRRWACWMMTRDPIQPICVPPGKTIMATCVASDPLAQVALVLFGGRRLGGHDSPVSSGAAPLSSRAPLVTSP
jgi:hypothetical protein